MPGTDIASPTSLLLGIAPQGMALALRAVRRSALPAGDMPMHPLLKVTRSLAAALAILLFTHFSYALQAADFSALSYALSAEQGQLCRAAVAMAEREAALPGRLLAAIARVESGRKDPGTGRFMPWPWTINAEGRGSFFPTKEAAIAAVRQLWSQGVRSIDVGCMQVNLRHHPDAFPSLEAAFDPLTNARYGARFLRELQAGAGGDWMQAAGFYHSQTQELAGPYRGMVAAAWQEEMGASPPDAAVMARFLNGGAGAGSLPAFSRTLPMAMANGGGGGSLSNGADKAQLLAASRPGRGLSAYRSLPIPIAGRGF